MKSYPKHIILNFTICIPNLNISQLVQNFQSWPTSLILKARCGMLDLNARSVLFNTAGICSVCNLNEVENTLHLIGICPLFKSFILS